MCVEFVLTVDNHLVIYIVAAEVTARLSREDTHAETTSLRRQRCLSTA